MVGKWVHDECLGISEVSDNLNGFCIAGVLDLAALYYGNVAYGFLTVGGNF
jgi:hypothetical protein